MSVIKNGKNSYRFECMINRKRFAKTFRFYAESDSEIQKRFYEWKIACEKGTFCGTDYTFKEFAELWLKNYVEPNYTYYVTKTYKNNLKNWVIPELGDYRLRDITPIILDGFINKLKRSNTKYEYRENKPLSNGTIEKIYENVRTIMKLAYKKGIIDSNPCDRVSLDLKRSLEEPLHYWEVDDYKKALDLLDKDENKLNAFIVEFALKTGLRRSEIFGIKWADIDFENSTVSINKTRQKVKGVMTICPCKTASSVRVITAPQSIMEKLAEIKSGATTAFVFEDVDYDSVTHWYRKWVKKNNLPYIKFHDLRHTHASLLLYKGVDIKTISKRLGHSNISTTMNTYTHVMRELDIKASEAIEAI